MLVPLINSMLVVASLPTSVGFAPSDRVSQVVDILVQVEEYVGNRQGLSSELRHSKIESLFNDARSIDVGVEKVVSRITELKKGGGEPMSIAFCLYLTSRINLEKVSEFKQLPCYSSIEGILYKQKNQAWPWSEEKGSLKLMYRKFPTLHSTGIWSVENFWKSSRQYGIGEYVSVH